MKPSRKAPAQGGFLRTGRNKAKTPTNGEASKKMDRGDDDAWEGVGYRHPHWSQYIPAARHPRPQLLQEARSGRLPGPSQAFVPDRDPSFQIGPAAKGRHVPGVLLGHAGAGGRGGGRAFLDFMNPEGRACRSTAGTRLGR